MVATIRKLHGLDKKERIGWEEMRHILDGEPMPQLDLLECSDDPGS
jgi:hypothetical protein